MKGWTKEHIDLLKASGKISGSVNKDRSVQAIALKKPKISIEKLWIESVLEEYCEENNYQLKKEYVFYKGRKWRLDWAVIRDINPKKTIITANFGVEYEGLFSELNGHTSVKGYTGNCDKYNAAQLSGFIILRYTSMNYKQLEADLASL